jgi:hypothetical protein
MDARFRESRSSRVYHHDSFCEVRKGSTAGVRNRLQSESGTPRCRTALLALIHRISKRFPNFAMEPRRLRHRRVDSGDGSQRPTKVRVSPRPTALLHDRDATSGKPNLLFVPSPEVALTPKGAPVREATGSVACLSSTPASA